MSYKYLNVNPNYANIEDCSVRTLSVVEGISWDEAYKKLSNSARKLGLMMNSVKAIETYLDRHYERVPIKVRTVGEFIDTHPYRYFCYHYEKSYNSLKRWHKL